MSHLLPQIKDYDDKVIGKLCLLVDCFGCNEAMAMLAHLEHRMRTKQARGIGMECCMCPATACRPRVCLMPLASMGPRNC